MKYVDNYILALLLGLEYGQHLSYKDDELEVPNIDRRLERDFVRTLQNLVFNALPDNEREILKEPSHFKVISSIDGDFPLRKFQPCIEEEQEEEQVKQQESSNILTFLKEYTKAVLSDNITRDYGTTTTWESKINSFNRSIDKEQLANDYMIDNKYIKHLPLLIYGYVNELVEIKNYFVELKEIPYMPEEEDSCVPAVKPLTDKDDEGQYIELSAKMDITELLEHLKQLPKDKSAQSKDVPLTGFSSKQIDFIKHILRQCYNFDTYDVSFSTINDMLGSDKPRVGGTKTSYDKLVNNNISKLNTIFIKNFNTKILEKGQNKTYEIISNVADDIESYMKRFRIKY